MRRYTFLAALSPALVRIESSQEGIQIWSLGKSRKETRCTMCGGRLPLGDHTWRPLTFSNNRMDRIGGDCIALMADEARERRR